MATPHFIPGKDHRHASREQQNDSEILDLTITQRFDCRIGCAALDSAVPTQIVIDAVAVIFSVFLIMLRVIGDEVIQRKTIVTSNEVDAVDG